MKNIKYLFGKIWRFDKTMILMVIVFTIFASVLPFIWVVVPAEIIKMAPLGQQDEMIRMVVIAGVVAMIGTFVVSFFRRNYRMRMNNIRYHMIRDLIEISLKMPYEKTLESKTLSRLNLAKEVISNPMMGAGGIILVLLQLFSGLFATLGFIGLIATLSWWVLIVLLIIVSLTFFLNERIAKRELDAWEGGSTSFRRMNYLNQDYAIDPNNRKDIKLYNLYDILSQKIYQFANDILTLRDGVRKTTINANVSIAALGVVRDVVVYGVLIQMFLSGQIDGSGFYLYTTGVTSFMVVLQQFLADVSMVKKEGNRLDDYISVENEFSHPVDGSLNLELNEAPIIELKNVSFRYPEGNRDIIKNLNLVIKQGEKLALVGANGSGKSTLVKLICRLYEPTTGSITINGTNIWDMQEAAYRKMLAVVFQDAIVLPFSVRENITMSDVTDEATITEAIEAANFNKILNELNHGLDTTLLRILDDDGIDLSGGQRQTLFLTRALYKKDSKILILDEPTAALDSIAERELYEKYSEITDDKTSIFVSHRLASTRFCDSIILLEDGEIIEHGTHADLINAQGAYAQLYDIQAKNYREEHHEEH